MKPETWNLKHILVVGIVLVSLTACLPAIPTPPTPTPTSNASPVPTVTLIQSPTSTATPPATATLTPLPTSTSTTTPAPSPLPTPVPATDAILIRGPYLQSVTSSSIIVAWETDRDSPGEVAYGVTGGYGSVVADPTVGTRHAVVLTGLAPRTFYHYRVQSGGAPLSTDATFRTAAGLGQPFTFVVFGDTRTGHQIHQAVVDHIAAQQPDFVIHTGDLVANGGSFSEWEAFFEIERDLMSRVPVFPMPGNHELNSSYYFDLFHLPGNEHWYTFDYGDARFVCLQVDGIAPFDPQSEQYGWLEATLAANTQPWLFVAFHIPPYSSVQDVFEDDVRQLTPLFERYEVDVVFNGHKHNYERNEVNGITYVVTGGGGAPLYPLEEREPTQAAFALAHHFVLLEINGPHLKATVISVDGTALDVFERSAD